MCIFLPLTLVSICDTYSVSEKLPGRVWLISLYLHKETSLDLSCVVDSIPLVLFMESGMHKHYTQVLGDLAMSIINSDAWP